MRKKKNGFTLIELISVLVILASLALIVTPLVMNIVKKAKESANKRIVDAYGKAVELAVATYLLDNGDYPTDLNGINVEYSGNEVVCNTKILNEDGSIYLSECSVKGTEVKDSSTNDGYYHYGKSSASVYQSYNVGDVVTYNGMNFYVIEDSDETSDSVTMLKAEPLTVDETNEYGTDENGVNHVNAYVSLNAGYDQVGIAHNQNGYGGMAYYSSENCGPLEFETYGPFLTDGCSTDYVNSEIKYVVDSWAKKQLTSTDLKKDSTGFSVRLITINELLNNFGYVQVSDLQYKSDDAILSNYSWIYDDNYSYWTMDPMNRPNDVGDVYVWIVDYYGIVPGSVAGTNATGTNVVRPVITLKKSAI